MLLINFIKRASVSIVGKQFTDAFLFTVFPRKIIIVFLLFFSSHYSESQNEKRQLDSILTVASQLENDSLYIDYLHKTFFNYCYKTPELAKLLSVYSIDKSQEINNTYLHIRSLLRKGIYHDIIDEKDSALIVYNEALEIAQLKNDKNAIGSVYNNIGLIHWNDENYNEAMSFYLKSFKIFEDLNEKRGQANSLNNIALILSKLTRYEEAVDYNKRCIELRKQIGDDYGLGASYTNISKDFSYLGERDSTIFYLHKAIKIKKSIYDDRGLAIAYNNLGLILSEDKKEKKWDSTLYYLHEANKIYKTINSLTLRAQNAKSIGEIYIETKDYNNAIKFFEEALTIIPQEESDTKLKIVSGLGDSYFLKNNYKNAAEYYKQGLVLRDSLYEKNIEIETQEIFEKYNSAEKEKQILIQRAELAEKEITLQKRNFQLWSAIILFLILSLIGYLFYNQQRLKNRQLQKENELKDALLKIETQNRLQEQRLRISRDLHDNIGAQLTFIISSLDNLRYGFDLPEKLDEKLNKIGEFTSATITDLRDTIWAMNKNEISFEDLRSRISNFIDKADLAAQHITFNFNVENTLNDKVFSSVKGMNVYRIIQEAINNSIKYSEASKIEVNINEKREAIRISIIDNGKGFDAKTVEFGNGIINMKKRAQDIKAEIKLISTTGNGTTIELTLPFE